jgi:arginyl-tRNA synthetase
VVRVDDVEAGLPPVLIRKSDGGYLYATTDLAAIRHRVGKLKADRVVYCVGAPQALHFKQVFAAAHKAGYTAREGRSAVLEHAAFGAILGEDGKPFRTRSGESAKLGELIDEAEGRALAAVTANNPDLPAGERAVVARAVAVAALRYGDLSSERIKDYVFSADRMVAFEGDTGPYLLYALVRVRNIFRKAAEQGVEVPGAKGAGEFKVEHAAEKGLALALLAYPAAVRGVAETLLPHRLCQTLYGLARAFSTFYDACPVLNAPTATVRAERLALCGLTERVLADGLTVLGIPTVERM